MDRQWQRLRIANISKKCNCGKVLFGITNHHVPFETKPPPIETKNPEELKEQHPPANNLINKPPSPVRVVSTPKPPVKPTKESSQVTIPIPDLQRESSPVPQTHPSDKIPLALRNLQHYNKCFCD